MKQNQVGIKNTQIYIETKKKKSSYQSFKNSKDKINYRLDAENNELENSCGGNDGEVIFEEITAENFHNCKRRVSSDGKDTLWRTWESADHQS